MGKSIVGTIIDGKYRIESFLGEGGSGSVYKAFQSDFNRYVAIKSLHAADWTNTEMLARFEREARILAKLSQENIVGVYTSIIDPGVAPYLVLEYVDGSPLSMVLQKSGALTERRTLDIVIQTAKALDAAHAEGIIHRDLKPQNIMLTALPRPDFVKVLDFGLSRLIEADNANEGQRLTRTGELIGTPQYMSPEQCSGAPLDARSDIYSLGCIMYECISGHAPFAQDNPLALLYKHRNEWPERLRAMASSKVSEEMELVIFKCLQKDPNERFQSAQDELKTYVMGLITLIGQNTSLLSEHSTMFVDQISKKNERQIHEFHTSLVFPTLISIGGWERSAFARLLSLHTNLATQAAQNCVRLKPN